MKYDYLIVGAGLFGSTFAYEVTKRSKRCLVIDKRDHIGGNLYMERIGGINVHSYGPHIFHTDDKRIWDYVNQFAEFNRFTNSPLANYQNEIFNLPFNMNTFNRLWGVVRPVFVNRNVDHRANRIFDHPGEVLGSDCYWFISCSLEARLSLNL